MRAVILKDRDIPQDQLDQVLTDFTDFINEHTELTPRFFIEETNYNFYATYIDSDGDIRPTHTYLKAKTDEVFNKYGRYGTDHVFLLIHEDNWLSDTETTKGIWGTNYSNIYHGYQVHYCRWDRDNIANSFGTMYHEMHHSFDALIGGMLDQDVNKLINVSNWDRDITHGGKNPPWQYIRYRENTEALKFIAPLLKDAYQKRRDLYYLPVTLLDRAIVLLQQLLYRKNGVKK